MSAWIIGFLLACVVAAPTVCTGQQTAGVSFASNGVQIAYVDRGRGEPVVLIHGFTGSYARHWEAPGVIDALEKAGYRAIAMDCRGHGQSGKPHDPSQYGMEMVRDVVRLLDHLNIPRAHIVGYSMGGSIAMQLLVKHADRLRTVTLLGAGWAGEDVSVTKAQMLALADNFARRDASYLIRGVTSGGANGPTDAEVAALSAALFARNDADALAAVARGYLPLVDVSRDNLRSIQVPVLALIGELDRMNMEGVKRMKGVMPALEVIELPGATHASSVRPAAAPLVEFLNKHRTN
jgi:pimeloyl-ACP methyl ester carboxylesterase